MSKLVIADTSCLIVLDKTGGLYFLKMLFAEIIVTSEIKAEYGEDLPDWIVVKDVSNKKNQQILELELDKGEASAIALGMENEDAAIVLKESLWRPGYKTKGAVGPKAKVDKTSLKFWWPYGRGRARKCKEIVKDQAQIEGEITPKKSIRKNGNPFGVSFGISNPLFGARKTNFTIGMYGPYVIEKRHNYRPEIHPCEAIWWEENGKLHLFSSHDESGRFQVYQDNVLEQEWRIPFRVDASSEAIHFSVRIVDAENPVSSTNISQEQPAEILVQGQKKASLAFSDSIHSEQPTGLAAIYFDKVGRLAENPTDLLGELVILIKVGHENNPGGFGQMHLEVSRVVSENRVKLVRY